ncbi:MAG: uroporphyrinogen decarboxylase [Pseudomonadales bacterium]|nr:MAG: uroporphyrinogen decarboxylase [Pseudomonadales bacterium]
MSPALENDLLLRALRREPVPRTPVWIMRQAGRYLPEYRAVREQAGDFMSLCQNPERACEVTLQPLARFSLDAAILFSDILTIPDAMGLGLSFAEGEGPRFARPLRDAAAIDALPTSVLDDLAYVFDAVSLIRRELHGRVPLIGFAGSPWTLATYMVEGRSTRDFFVIKKMLYTQPEILHRLLDKLSSVTADYLVQQVRSGAQALQVFDTWGGVLSDAAYQSFSLVYMQKLLARLHAALDEQEQVPVILFTKGGGGWLEKLAESGCSAVGCDWSVDLGSARQRIFDSVALQGNMDPAVLRASPASIEAEVQRILASYGKHTARSGHVFNLGHGITPDIDPENVNALVEAVHKHSPAYHPTT